MSRLVWTGAIIGLLVAAPGCNLIDFDDLSCDDPPPPAWTEKTDFESAPSGSLFTDHSVLAFDIIYTPAPERPPEREFDRMLSDGDQPFEKAGELAENGRRPAVAVALVHRDPLWKDKPEKLERSSFGLDAASKAAVQKPGQQLQLRFALPGRNPLHLHRRAAEITRHLAARTGGIVRDPVTREIYSAKSWKAKLTRWSGEFPPLSDWLLQDWFYGGGLVRIVTAGMSKFGLPDLQIDRVPEHLGPRVSLLLRLACQAMLETGELGPGGILTLRVEELSDGSITQAHEKQRAPDATLDLRLQLEKVEGRPRGWYQRLLAVSVRGHGTHQESLIALLRRVYGQDLDSWRSFTLTDEIKAASAKARKHLLQVLKPRWQDGRFELGESLEVKVRLEGPHGKRNYMWVQVVEWRGRLIGGVLKSDARDVQDKKAGSTVEVIDDWVFDYRHILPDGTQEGNETAALIDKAAIRENPHGRTKPK